jgi:hypothetical protein
MSEVGNQGLNSLKELPVPQTAEPHSSRCICTLQVPWNQRGCFLGLFNITLLLIQSSCEFASSGYSLSADGSAPTGKKKKQIDMKHIKSDRVPQADGKQSKGEVEEEWHHRMLFALNFRLLTTLLSTSSGKDTQTLIQQILCSIYNKFCIVMACCDMLALRSCAKRSQMDSDHLKILLQLCRPQLHHASHILRAPEITLR